MRARHPYGQGNDALTHSLPSDTVEPAYPEPKEHGGAQDSTLTRSRRRGGGLGGEAFDFGVNDAIAVC